MSAVGNSYLAASSPATLRSKSSSQRLRTHRPASTACMALPSAPLPLPGPPWKRDLGQAASAHLHFNLEKERERIWLRWRSCPALARPLHLLLLDKLGEKGEGGKGQGGWAGGLGRPHREAHSPEQSPCMETFACRSRNLIWLGDSAT